MASDTCCTCAKRLVDVDYPVDSKSEKSAPAPSHRELPCCNRYICGACISKNNRFQSYCPYCQISAKPSPLPQGLRDPPEYSREAASEDRTEVRRHSPPHGHEDAPPDYETIYSATGSSQHGSDAQEDVIHHLKPDESLSSLSLAYNVPLSVLRAHNRLHADHLLAARRTISIPASHYRGPSLSDRPVDDPDEVERKANLRKFMMATKCHEYSMAELYLKQASGVLDDAISRWVEDEKWEKENPFQKGKQNGKRNSKSTSGGLVGQI